MQQLHILLSNPKQNLATLSKKHLLVDTNFLIDAARNISQFESLLRELSVTGFTLVSLEATFIEFTKGSKSLADYEKKVAFYKKIIETVLPVDAKINENVADLSRVLLKKGGQVSYVDCLLLGTAMKYKESLYFLTKDRSDVPISLFTPVAAIMIETPDNNCSYIIYEYDEKVYRDILLSLVGEK
jgi:predicted nucleic acid-binding protein